jgi:hypothetical protein
MMDGFPRYFAFGHSYMPNEDYVRCDSPQRSFVVSPGAGEVVAEQSLSLPRCLAFVRQGVMSETSGAEIRGLVSLRDRLVAYS